VPRRRKAPYVTLKRYKDGRAPTWVIRDGQLTRGTGCDEFDSVGAEKALAKYITKKHDPKKALNTADVNSIPIVDVCALEIKHISKRKIDQTYKSQLISAIQRIGNWFAEYKIGDLTADLQERYAEERVLQPSAHRDLKLLQAAINRSVKSAISLVTF
jgi:hypothetical protein